MQFLGGGSTSKFLIFLSLLYLKNSGFADSGTFYGTEKDRGVVKLCFLKVEEWSKDAYFPFFEPPDGPMTSKITLNLGITKFYTADQGIFEILWGA